MADDTAVLSNKPPDDDFRQQRLRAWVPIMTPLKVISVFVIIGAIFIPLGVTFMAASDKIYQDTIIYDGHSSSTCDITTMNQQRKCRLQFNITESVTGPLYVYYQLENFYQNHRRYVASRDPLQLRGETGQTESELKTSCLTDYKNDTNSKLMSPCGLIANSFFNDSITFKNDSSSPAGLSLDENDIAWDTDDDKFAQPNGFKSEYVANDTVPCGDVYCEGFNNNEGCAFYPDDSSPIGQGWNYCYPDSDTTQYLYEVYPDFISPIDGVTDDHFKVWMRVAALPKFRKLYGKIHGDFNKGDYLVFDIVANFEVGSFDGTKGLVISTVDDLGGKNSFLGITYIITGTVSLLFALLFIVKQISAPRPLADESLLNWSVNVDS